jgi:SAM-dependent methyltransferase
VAIIARQFGRLRGPLGRLIGHGMARANAGFSRWVIQQIAGHYRGSTGRIAELGPGPGIGLETVLRQYPQARVWGIDLSPEMLSQSRKRNLAELRAGRLTLTEGSAASLAAIAPVDVVVANHVLYFWHQSADELARIRCGPAGCWPWATGSNRICRKWPNDTSRPRGTCSTAPTSRSPDCWRPPGSPPSATT